MSKMDDLRAAKNSVRRQLLQLGLGGNVISRRATTSVRTLVATAGRNVHALGVGRKIVQGVETEELALRFYVVQKLPESLLAPRDRLPERVAGLTTDVVAAEPAFALQRAGSKRKAGTRSRAKNAKDGRSGNGAAPKARARRRDLEAVAHSSTSASERPVRGGISAGHPDITVGTLGCLCGSRRTGDDPTAPYVLSNNHVWADVNRALIGDPLYQPGPADGGTFQHHFANVHRYVLVHLGGSIPNRVDAAIGLLLASVPHRREICTIGPVAGTVTASQGMPVRKHGRSTGYTEGIIDDADYDLLVGMDHDDPSVLALFEDQLRIVSSGAGPFGIGGDSGSAVVHGQQDLVTGLYFAGPPSGSYGVANRIEHVLTELEIDI